LSTKSNISSLISPDILKTLSTSVAIKALGNQIKDKAKEQVISSFNNKVGELTNQIETIIKAEIQAGVKHGTELEKFKVLYNNKQITEEDYNKAVTKENEAYDALLVTYKLQREKLNADIQSILKDPYKKIKDQQAKFKKGIKDARTKIKNLKKRSKKDLAKQVLSNAAKTLAPIIALQLVNQFTHIISQRKKLEELVEQVNTYIDTQVKDEQTANAATNLRNNAINLINNSIAKLTKLEKTLERVTLILTIYSLVISLLSAIPIPTAVPPGIGIPLNVITKINNTIQKATKLVAALSAVLAIATMLLGNEITYLNELRDRLKEVSLKLDGKTLSNLNDQELSNLSNEFLPAGGDYGTYKGFKFTIKEEQNPSFTVRGNKRRYAVAIDRYGVEMLKSDYSFTQDPNDLVEQLKLIIDQRNLQG
jgi:hypothetical protein